jgi:hypothetical protein
MSHAETTRAAGQSLPLGGQSRTGDNAASDIRGFRVPMTDTRRSAHGGSVPSALEHNSAGV